MNVFKQLDSGIITSEKEIEKLAQAEKAKILILSDTHGYYSLVEDIIKDFGSSCSAICFAGDGIIDIVELINMSFESPRLNKQIPPIIAFVAGNCDDTYYRVGSSKSKEIASTKNAGFSLVAPSRQILKVCGHSLFIAHGHSYSVDSHLNTLHKTVKAMGCSIGIFGHIHVPVFEHYDDVYLINPGSVSRARGRSEPGFAIMTLESSKAHPQVDFYRIRKKTLGRSQFEKIAQE